MMGFIAGLLAGIAGAMGLGGGSFLIIYLVLFADIPQLEAQGINLIFFLPCAAVAMFFHFKNKLVNLKVFPAVITGLIGAVLGTFLSGWVAEELLQKIFGGLLIVLGIFSVFKKQKKEKG